MFQVSDDGDASTIFLDGDIDLAKSSGVRRQLLDILYERPALTVDLAGVEYMDSSGIACLVEAYQYARKHGKEFWLQSVNIPVMRVLKLSRLDSVLPTKNSG